MKLFAMFVMALCSGLLCYGQSPSSSSEAENLANELTHMAKYYQHRYEFITNDVRIVRVDQRPDALVALNSQESDAIAKIKPRLDKLQATSGNSDSTQYTAAMAALTDATNTPAEKIVLMVSYLQKLK
jgi:hypothetical protein